MSWWVITLASITLLVVGAWLARMAGARSARERLTRYPSPSDSFDEARKLVIANHVRRLAEEDEAWEAIYRLELENRPSKGSGV